MRGIAELLADAEPDPDDDALATLDAPVLVRFDDSERPGATADTSAAKPAVSIAAPAIIQRRVNLTRASAASRSNAARDRSVLGCLYPIFESIIGGENQRSVRAV